jgi:hypothetical protein
MRLETAVLLKACTGSMTASCMCLLLLIFFLFTHPEWSVVSLARVEVPTGSIWTQSDFRTSWALVFCTSTSTRYLVLSDVRRSDDHAHTW